MVDVTNMRIYELRDYARKIGVKSPTSKTKSTLINEINLINEGKLKPFNTVKGRKPIISFALTEKNLQFINNELTKMKISINKTLDKFGKKIKKNNTAK